MTNKRTLEFIWNEEDNQMDSIITEMDDKNIIISKTLVTNLVPLRCGEVNENDDVIEIQVTFSINEWSET